MYTHTLTRIHTYTHTHTHTHTHTATRPYGLSHGCSVNIERSNKTTKKIDKTGSKGWDWQQSDLTEKKRWQSLNYRRRDRFWSTEKKRQGRERKTVTHERKRQRHRAGYIHIYVYINIYIYIYIYICMYVVHTYVYVLINTYTWIHMYVNIYMYIIACLICQMSPVFLGLTSNERYRYTIRRKRHRTVLLLTGERNRIVVIARRKRQTQKDYFFLSHEHGMWCEWGFPICFESLLILLCWIVRAPCVSCN